MSLLFILKIALIVLLVLTSLLLTLFILLHKGRGGGLSDMFGGGVTSSLGSSGVAERNLNRLTVIVSLVWFATIVGLFTLLYLVSQVLVYAGEIAIVRRRRLWPRALDMTKPTTADRRALTYLAREQERTVIERVDTRFDAEPEGPD